jgi:putative transposase
MPSGESGNEATPDRPEGPGSNSPGRSEPEASAALGTMMGTPTALKGRVHPRFCPMPQSLAKVYVHAVFSTKNREPVLLDGWRDEFFAVVGGAVNHLGCQSLLVGGVADHVHLLFQLSRTLAIADAIGRTKTATAAWVNGTRRPPARFQWQAGYGVFSVGQEQVGDVRGYIANQEEHHRAVSFQDELRGWLARYELEWNEDYVWD